MHLPIGISDFSKLITVESDSGAGYLFVDKSLLSLIDRVKPENILNTIVPASYA